MGIMGYSADNYLNLMLNADYTLSSVFILFIDIIIGVIVYSSTTRLLKTEEIVKLWTGIKVIMATRM